MRLLPTPPAQAEPSAQSSETRPTWFPLEGPTRGHGSWSFEHYILDRKNLQVKKKVCVQPPDYGAVAVSQGPLLPDWFSKSVLLAPECAALGQGSALWPAGQTRPQLACESSFILTQPRPLDQVWALAAWQRGAQRDREAP